MTLYTFDELITNSREDEIGKKALSLIEMRKIGARVPEGFVVGVEALEMFWEGNDLSRQISAVTDLSSTEDSGASETIKSLYSAIMAGSFDASFMRELEAMLDSFSCKRFAVRSSGNCEDLEDASFAGLYETKLNVSGIENICESIKECWSSLYTERVIQYCLNKGIALSQMKMSLIIQRMIPSEKSGVLFSVDPLSGMDKQMLIEACFGLGEALVGGEVTPDQYIYDWYEDRLVSKTVNAKDVVLLPIDDKPFVHKIRLEGEEASKQVLDNQELADLVELSLRIQEHYGYPVDIEWAMCDGVMYFVQTRPITQIGYSGIDGEWTTADFKDGGVSSTVCSPFMWSLYDYIWESELPKYIESVKLLSDEPVALWGDMFFGRPYWNVGAVKNGLKKLPGYVERSFDEDSGIAVSYEGDGYVTKTSVGSAVAGIRALLAMKKSFSRAEREWEPFREEQKRRLNDLAILDVSEYSSDEYFLFYEKFINEEFFKSEAKYFNHIYDNSNVATLFKESTKGIKSDVAFIELISGLDDVSHISLNVGIWDISRSIISEPELKTYWSHNSVEDIVDDFHNGVQFPGISSFKKLVDENCFHSTRELDITVPRYEEDPSFIIDSIKSSMNLGDSYSPKEIAKKQKNRYEERYAQFLSDTPFYKRSSVKKSLSRMRAFLWWREEYRELSTHFYHYVRKYTLQLAPHFREWNIINEKEDLFFLTKDNIIDVIQQRLSHEVAAALVKKNKRYYSSFRNFSNPNELGGKYSTGNSQGTLPVNDSGISGIPCSPGIVEGPVKVIKDIFDADRLEKGDILITKFTDPGWTPKFSLISAVATETGGVLSHAAVISREYGIPAVLAIPGLTKTLVDGQWIRINGATGSLECINDPGVK